MINDILETLKPVDKEALELAFELEKSHIVNLPDSKFIAVNLFNPDNFNILTQENNWYYGEYK